MAAIREAKVSGNEVPAWERMEDHALTKLVRKKMHRVFRRGNQQSIKRALH